MHYVPVRGPEERLWLVRFSISLIERSISSRRRLASSIDRWASDAARYARFDSSNPGVPAPLLACAARACCLKTYASRPPAGGAHCTHRAPSFERAKSSAQRGALQRMQWLEQIAHTALPQLGLPSSCAPAHTGVVSVTRPHVLQRHRPSDVINMPGIFVFTAEATCPPFTARCRSISGLSMIYDLS